jgi:hypothetical protein
MENLIDKWGLATLSFPERYRLLLSVFCLLTFILLFYFYKKSTQKSHSNKDNYRGLLFLSLAFLFYFIFGCIFILTRSKSIPVLLSGAINICFILSFSFFSHGVSKIDKFAVHKAWRFIVLVIGLIYLFQYTFNRPMLKRYNFDILISSLTIMIFGILLVWDFMRKKMTFMGIISGVSLAMVIILQIYSPIIIGRGKFVNVNTTILFPALFLAIISVSITFNWINELNFQDVAKIYSSGGKTQIVQAFFEKKISKDGLKNGWQKNIMNDDLEKVIEEMVFILEKRNESLDLILNLASRNSRNNTNRLKAIIKDNDYQINRNQISSGIISMIDDF